MQASAGTSLVAQAHASILQVVHPGDTVIDATTGNGHDTLFLAQAVGRQGKVYGFDIQQSALDLTYQRLQQHHAESQVCLFHAGHEMIPILIPQQEQTQIRAVMFNLGYLPGGDKSRITGPATTLAAAAAAVQMLMPGGRITLLAYTGHAGGREECDAIAAWAGTLPREHYQVSTGSSHHPLGPAPRLFVIERSLR